MASAHVKWNALTVKQRLLVDINFCGLSIKRNQRVPPPQLIFDQPVSLTGGVCKSLWPCHLAAAAAASAGTGRPGLDGATSKSGTFVLVISQQWRTHFSPFLVFFLRAFNFLQGQYRGRCLTREKLRSAMQLQSPTPISMALWTLFTFRDFHHRFFSEFSSIAKDGKISTSLKFVFQ